MNAGCAGKTEISWERVPYLSALEVCSRQGAIQIHVYLTLPSAVYEPLPGVVYAYASVLQAMEWLSAIANRQRVLSINE